jgi:hypothetical protein
MTLRPPLSRIAALTALAGLLPLLPARFAMGAAAPVTGPTVGLPTVWTQHYDNSRTGANLQETRLNTSNVNVKTFGKLFSIPVDGQVYAQPLYVPSLAVTGVYYNVLYIATMENSLYAVNADNGLPIWQKNYGPPVPATDVQPNPTGQNIIGNIGILSTPVIDTATNTLYFVVRNKNPDGTYHQSLRAVDLASGADKFGSPQEITATSSGLVFDPKIQNQRPALTLANGNVYIAWAGHDDNGDYHGWIVSYQASNINTQTATFVATTSSNVLGGVWMSGQGLSVDSSGNLYAVTGNGLFDGVTNYGDSVLKLSSNLTLLDYFSPSNQTTLNAQDQDLGSGGVLILPNSNQLVNGGKDGRLFLLDPANLGQFHNNQDDILEEFQGVTLFGPTSHIHGSPVYWNAPSGSAPVNGPAIYLWGDIDYGHAFAYVDGAFGTGAFKTTPVSSTNLQAPKGMPGGILSISANGSAPGSGILWANVPFDQDAVSATVAGELHAFDASNLGNELWNSYQNQARDDYGNLAKYCPPVVANGRVYMATFSKQVCVYGLLNQSDVGTASAASTTHAGTGTKG